MGKAAMSLAVKRYMRRFMTAMGIYVILIMGVSWAFSSWEFAGPLAWLLAILPGLPILVVIGVMGLYLKEESDEFQRNVQVEAMLWGVGLTLSATTVWGLLEFYVDAPRLPVFLAFPIWCGAMGVAQYFVRRRYK
jgi:hypothetical protein